MVSSPMYFDDTETFVDRIGPMVNNVIITNKMNVSKQPNAEAQAFYNMPEATQRPL